MKVYVKGAGSLMVALVTGGSRGIGAEIARSIAQMGCFVALTYNKNAERAEKVVYDIRELGASARAFRCDVSRRSDVQALVSDVSRAFGSIDVLVNNAGISHEGLFTDITEKEWDEIFNVNVKGIFNCTQEIIPSMISNKHGKIINISSMWGQVGASCEVAYSASKAAVIGFTKALAKEVGPSGINVNCICPGVIQTDMLAPFLKDDIRALEEETPLGRIGTPSDVANLVAFLASEKANFITGQIFGVNGGFVI